MKSPTSIGPSRAANDTMLQSAVEKVTGRMSRQVLDSLAIEEPLEIQLTYGPSNVRQTTSISVTMRTPGNDFEPAAGSLMSEGMVQNANDIEQTSFRAISAHRGCNEARFQTEHCPSGLGYTCYGKPGQPSTQFLYNIELRHLWQSVTPRVAYSLPTARGKHFQNGRAVALPAPRAPSCVTGSL
jgi:formate dehydrogenase assembly factor FdhD